MLDISVTQYVSEIYTFQCVKYRVSVLRTTCGVILLNMPHVNLVCEAALWEHVTQGDYMSILSQCECSVGANQGLTAFLNLLLHPVYKSVCVEKAVCVLIQMAALPFST